MATTEALDSWSSLPSRCVKCRLAGPGCRVLGSLFVHIVDCTTRTTCLYCQRVDLVGPRDHRLHHGIVIYATSHATSLQLLHATNPATPFSCPLQEAANALQGVGGTHLYGRRLVVEYAKGDGEAGMGRAETLHVGGASRRGGGDAEGVEELQQEAPARKRMRQNL